MGLITFFVCLFFLCYAVLILYYRSGWNQLETFTLDKHAQPETKVSIIIPARNEANTIGDLLKDILSQYYPTELMQVIVINDHSEDDTAAKVSEFKGVHLINLVDVVAGQKINAYKKKAIEVGIEQATGDLIITTDADCRMQPYWLLSMVSFFETKKCKLVAGPVCMHSSADWFHRFQSMDFMTMQGITGALSFFQNGAMCNGANLAYTKEAFKQVNGFRDIDDIASGDDMLLMYKIEKMYPEQTAYLKCHDSIVQTESMSTFREFMNQRIRWASKATKFKDKRLTWVLYLVYFFNALFPLLLIMSLFNYRYLYTFVSLLLAKAFIEFYFLYPVAQFFRKDKEIGLFVMLQWVHIPYILLSGLLAQRGSYQWKNREVN